MTTLRKPTDSTSPAEPAQPRDEKLKAQVQSSLGSTGYQQLRRIDVDVADGHVMLSGRVARYYLRQIAQQAAMNTDGVETVGIEIEVAR